MTTLVVGKKKTIGVVAGNKYDWKLEDKDRVCQLLPISLSSGEKLMYTTLNRYDWAAAAIANMCKINDIAYVDYSWSANTFLEKLERFIHDLDELIIFYDHKDEDCRASLGLAHIKKKKIHFLTLC